MFKFKQKPQDFIVEEKIPYSIGSKGKVFYVFFEKKNKNTMDILHHLMRRLHLQRNHLGIAWLKDKYGITRQRISIYKNTLSRRWWPSKFLKALSEVAQVLKYWWGDELLKVGKNTGNLFFLRLRDVDWAVKNGIEKELALIAKNWFPNFFGTQRFWRWGENWKIGKKLIEGSYHKNLPSFEKQFKVQALSSRLFNQYLLARIRNFGKDWDNPLEGDLMNESWIVLGPVYWRDLPLPVEGSQAWKFEEQILKDFFGKWLEILEKFKDFGVFGIRRPILVIPKDLKWKWQGKDLLLMFELPRGSYATSLVEYLKKKVENNFNQ